MKNIKNTILVQYLSGIVLLAIVAEMNFLIMAMTSIIYSSIIGSIISYTVAKKIKSTNKNSNMKEYAKYFSNIAASGTLILFVLFMMFGEDFKEFVLWDKFTLIFVALFSAIFIKYFLSFKFKLETQRFVDHK